MNIKDIPSDLLAKMAVSNQGTELGDDLAAEIERRQPKKKAAVVPKPVVAPPASPQVDTSGHRWTKPKPARSPKYPKNNPINPEYYNPEPPCRLDDLHTGWVEWTLTVLTAFAIGYFWSLHR